MCLTLKSREPALVIDEAIRQDLDRDLALQLYVTSAIHLTHAAGAQKFGDFVRAQLCA